MEAVPECGGLHSRVSTLRRGGWLRGKRKSYLSWVLVLPALPFTTVIMPLPPPPRSLAAPTTPRPLGLPQTPTNTPQTSTDTSHHQPGEHVNPAKPAGRRVNTPWQSQRWSPAAKGAHRRGVPADSGEASASVVPEAPYVIHQHGELLVPQRTLPPRRIDKSFQLVLLLLDVFELELEVSHGDGGGGRGEGAGEGVASASAAASLARDGKAAGPDILAGKKKGW